VANIDNAFEIDNWIALQDPSGLQVDAVLIVQGSIDPTIGGFEAPIGSLYLRRDGSIYSKNSAPDTGWTLNGVTGSVAWGDITGIVSNQTDLQAELDAKVNVAGDTMTGNLNIFPVTGNSILTLKSPTGTSTTGINLENSSSSIVYTEVFDETTGNILIDSVTGVDMLFNNAGNGDVITLNNVSFRNVTIGSPSPSPYIMPDGDGTVGQVIQTDGAGNLTFATLAGSNDELVKVSADDTTAGFLLNKVLGGTLISVVETNPAGNEAITINTTAEINTTSNLGAGEGIFSAKVGSDIRLKSLVAGTNITLTSDVNEITINSTSGGVTITTINGQPVPTFIDTTRSNKILSIETTTHTFDNKELNNNTWMDIASAKDSTAGYIIPHDGTIVKATAHSSSSTTTRAVNLYVNSVLNTSNIILFPSSSDFSDTTTNVDVVAGDLVQLRGGTGSSSKDVVAVLYIKWRG